MPLLRPVMSLDNYNGPQQGELHWTGMIPRGRHLIIQGGKASNGTVTNDLPRVPVTVQTASAGVRVLEPPTLHNHWDRLVMRNTSDLPLTDMIIRWKVAK